MPIYVVDVIREVINRVYEWIGQIEKFDQLPIFFHNIGLALLTILIPFAIAILADFYQKRGDKTSDFVELDLLVILDCVFQIKQLIFYSLLIFIPFIFKELFPALPLIVAIFLSLIGIIFLIRIIFNVYKWTKGNVLTYRFSYLEKSEKSPDFENAWKSVWYSKSIAPPNEIKLFEIFSRKIDKIMIQKGNINTLVRLLSDFSNSIEKRSPYVSVHKVFPKVLEWNLIAWKYYWTNFSEGEERNEFTSWVMLRQVLSDIIKKIGECALLQRLLFSTLFLDHFKKHIETSKDVQIIVGNRERHYIEDLFRLFYKLVFEKVAGSDESDDFWSSFPHEWKVTKSNLLSKENRIARISYEIFIKWAAQRIQASQTSDPQLNDVAQNLFPEVHPEMWAVALIFVFSPYSPENRIKSVVERPWIFGYPSRVFAFSGEKKIEEIMGEQRAQEEIELKNTNELILLLFKEVFTEQLLNEYIKQANELKYPDDSAENRRKLQLLKLFYGLLATIEKKNSSL